MNAFYSKLVNRKVFIPVLFLMLTLAGVLLIPSTIINYDMAQYLPKDAGTKQAIEVAKVEFDYPGTAQVMAKEISVVKAAELKKQIADIDGVKTVVWIDDVADITKPLLFIDQKLLDNYYKDECALYSVEFTEDNFSNRTSLALQKIRQLDEKIIIAGNAENSKNMKDHLYGEITNVVAIVLPICLLILMIASHSWLDPFLYLFVIGVSIAINMGTNAFFGSVSFITNSMGAVLQLAISMDYSIFLLHRYYEERDNGLGVKEAVVKASVSSMSSVAASALTTVAGFAALLIMQYRIGADIGFTLAKGIFISFLTVMLLMPAMIMLLNKTLEKTKHRSFLPSFGKIGKGVVKVRYVILALAVVIIIPCMLAQGRISFMYGDTSVTSGEGQVALERKNIEEKFGVYNPVMILVPAGEISREKALADELKTIPHIKSVTALVTIADHTIASSFFPDSLTESFRSPNYDRMVVDLNIDGENEEVYQSVKDIRVCLQKHYPDKWYAAGTATSYMDIKDTVTADSTWVTALSLIAVGLIVLFSLRSLSIPVILLFVIQGSIWINMSIPYFTGFNMAYIGYLVISSLQLGSTIDYGILLSNRYLDFRAEEDKKNAAVSALKTAGPSILVSALILATAGLAFGLISKVGSIAEFGVLIGRGALVSCILTLALLPALLILLDKFVINLSLKRRSEKSEKESGSVHVMHNADGTVHDIAGGRAGKRLK